MSDSENTAAEKNEPSPQAAELAAEKRAHRERARAARCALDPGFCASAAETAAERLLALPELRAARIVLAYVATAEEIDPASAVEALHGAGKSVALPRVEAPGVLGIHLWSHGDELESGPFGGIPQPLDSAPRVPLAAIDVVVVPGVAFDLAGRRLGYGGGFYDRLLPRLRPDCIRIGLAYDEQITDSLPVAEHDERVRIVVTPTRVAHAR